MTSWLVWLVLVIVAVLLGFIGYHFVVSTLRWVTVALAAAVVLFATLYGATHHAAASTDLVSSFTRGLDELSAALFVHRITALGQVGWLVIIAILAFGYRELEVWAMHWQPPTVDTSALGHGQPGTQKSGASRERMTDGQRHDRVCAELRFRLPAVEVRAPAILPGGTRPHELASIAENSGVTGSGLAGAIINFAGMLWPNPRRYQVRVWIEPTCEKERAMRVTVDLGNPRTGGSIGTKTLAACDLDETASVVAGYVARQIFQDDRTTPPWCVGSFDGSDLAAILVAGRQRVSPESPEEVCGARLRQISILENCRLDAGVARYELAQLYDLAGHHVEALRLHAINREQYPRFYRGRYRLGMSLEMIANPEFQLSGKEAAEALEESLSILHRCDVPKGAAAKYAATKCAAAKHHDMVLTDDLKMDLLMAAQEELRAVRRQLTLLRIVWAMFWRRDERTIWKRYLRLREREHFHDGARVAELLVAVRLRLNKKYPGLTRKEIRRTKRAMNIAAAITGDSAPIEALLNSPKTQDTQESSEQKRQAGKISRPGPKAHKTRWLPLQCRTPSWQAAYNTACLYAALESGYAKTEDEKCEMAERVIMSLTRVINDRTCEMDRPSDWISKDPDFSHLASWPNRKPAAEKFQRFLSDQKRRDYPTTKLAHH